MTPLVNKYLRWRRQAAVGCVFARVTAVDPARYRQDVREIKGIDPTAVATGIEAALATMINDPVTQAATIVLPGLKKIERLVGTAQVLGAMPGWTLDLSLLDHTPGGPMVAFRVTRAIQHNGLPCPSELLFFGKFDWFPNTRRAPVTALEVFVGTPLPHDPKTGILRTIASRANIADLEMIQMPPGVYQRNWSRSETDRLSSLGGVPDPRAKAKVSFVVPLDAATRLECLP